MLKTPVIHPQILAALGSAGHTSKVLITDGNYPASTTIGPNAVTVSLNFMPGILSATQILQGLVQIIPIEKSQVMDYAKQGPYALAKDPEIWGQYQEILQQHDHPTELEKVERFAFYQLAASPDVALVIITAELRIYANLMLTLGVVR